MSEASEEIKKTVKRIKKQEASIRMYMVMKRYLMPEKESSTTFIQVPDKETFKTNAQKAIEKYSEENNKEKQNWYYFCINI